METITINKDELKNIINDSIIDILTKRQDLLLETFEDICMINAIERGETGRLVDEKEIFDILKKKK